MMRKRILVIFFCIALLFSACVPKDNGVVLAIGEEAGKAAGLALINRAFDAKATEATVEYQARAETTYHSEAAGKDVLLEPDRVYVVKVAPKAGETEYYYAEVDAVTGFAFRAERYATETVFTEEQQKQVDALGTLGEMNPDDFLLTQQNAQKNIMDIMANRLEPELPVLRVYPDIIETDSFDLPQVMLEYFVLMEDGTVYNLTLCWPTLELIKVYIRD
jgi:hypothetical protein